MWKTNARHTYNITDELISQPYTRFSFGIRLSFQLHLGLSCVLFPFSPLTKFFVYFSSCSLRINQTTIPQGSTVKYLGLHLDSKLTWREHITKKKEKT